MGAIYKGAALTIIAAAGDSPHSGLPGVNGTPRRQHYSHAVGTSSQKIGGLEDPYNEIHNSVWNTRGWTYQELVLSRRRLVFTRSQIYFQCKAMHRIESLPSQATASVYGSMPDNNCFHNELQAFHGMDTRSTAQSLYIQISEYFLRRLSFPEDTVKAVTGVIHAFELQQSTDRVGATHVFGLPILYSKTSPTFCLPVEKDHDTKVFTPMSTFAYSLAWFVSGDTGETNSTAIDISFPSWSWASVKASQKPDVLSEIMQAGALVIFSCEKDLQVWLHDKSEGSLDLNHYIKTPGPEDGRSLLPMISIRSWMVSCDTELIKHGYPFYISGFQGQFEFWPDFLDTQLSDDLAAIYLGHLASFWSLNDKELRELRFLVVEKVDDSTWRRVGLLGYYNIAVPQGEDTLTLLNRVRPEGGWEMRTLCLV